MRSAFYAVRLPEDGQPGGGLVGLLSKAHRCRCSITCSGHQHILLSSLW